ncbi:MAG: TonB-dependent receptor [Gemmatimonadota bacterium]|nr:MAG: TonB-dependent receptor [Gemmatimonadota bacterium]
MKTRRRWTMALIAAALFGLATGPESVAGTQAAQAQPASQDTVQRMVAGRVLSEASGAPLPLALVELGEGADYRAALADEEGRYLLRDVPPGRQPIRVTTLDHKPLEVFVEVPEAGVLALDLLLRLHPVGLEGITVVTAAEPVAAVGGAGAAARGTPADPELRALESTPGAVELGLTEGARAEPITDPHDPESALYVRGAASDLKLVLLDGAPVYAPFHLGGLLDAFQPGVLESAWLYAGGAPARYDGGLSYILDLRTRPGRAESVASAGAIDNLGAGARVESGFADGAFLAAGRVIHRVGTDGFVGDPLPYGYADALARLDIRLGARHRLAATGFFNREAVRLNENSVLTTPAHWGNAAGSIRYNGWLAGSRTEITAALGRFDTRLPIGVETPGVADGSSTRARLTADLVRPLRPAVTLAFGASYDRQEIDYSSYAISDSGTIWLARNGVADALGAYGEASWRAADDLLLRAGLRANAFVSASRAQLAPRLALAWYVSESSTLTLAAGRYHQYLRIPETILSSNLSAAWSELALGADTLGTFAEEDDRLAVAGANHVVVGLSHSPRENLRLGFEGYYKAFDGAPEVDDLRASGVDLWVGWELNQWAAWAGYSLAWAWREELGATSQRFSARHLLSGGITAPLPSGVRFDMRLATSHGIPFTPIPIGDRAPAAGEVVTPTADQVFDAENERVLAGAPEGSYLRLDAQVSRGFRARLFGTEFELVPYLKVLNALDRRDALFYQFEAGRDLRPRSLQAVPLLPVIGIEWRG